MSRCVLLLLSAAACAGPSLVVDGQRIAPDDGGAAVVRSDSVEVILSFFDEGRRSWSDDERAYSVALVLPALESLDGSELSVEGDVEAFLSVSSFGGGGELGTGTGVVTAEASGGVVEGRLDVRFDDQDVQARARGSYEVGIVDLD